MHSHRKNKQKTGLVTLTEIDLSKSVPIVLTMPPCISLPKLVLSILFI